MGSSVFRVWGLVLLLLGAAAALEDVEVVPQAQGFNGLDAQLLVEEPAHAQQLDEVPLWKEEGYEPYSDELDSYVTSNGMPYPLNDDLPTHNRYEYWLQNYKRIPNIKPIPWSYDEPESEPDLWASLKKEYQTCDPDLTGGTSSPIDIPVGRAVPTCYGPSFPVKVGPEWSTTPGDVMTEYLDNGKIYTMDVMHCGQDCKICKAHCEDAPEIPGSVEHGPVVLDRIMVHTPAEHKLDSEPLDLELQFVHCSSDGDGYHRLPCAPKLIIAVLFKDGGASVKNPKWMVDLLPTLKGVSTTPQTLAKDLKFGLFKDTFSDLLEDFYGYFGSETYPPCDQGVQWMISTKVLELSSGAIEAFKRLTGENNRPTFALGKRTLKLYKPEAPLHWTYDGPRGQAWWGSQKEYASCGKVPDCERLPNQKLRDICLAEQKIQSPVDLYINECKPNVDYGGRPCVQPVGLRPVKFDIGPNGRKSVEMYLKDCECEPCNNPNNHYTLTIKPKAGVTFTYYNTIYNLKEITFHTPSQHSVEGVRKDMEMTFEMEKSGCVSCGNKCCTPNNNKMPKLKYSILFEVGDKTPSWIAGVAAAAGAATGTPDDLVPDLTMQIINVNLTPLMSKYYTYEGSETTPPCHGGVTWLIMYKTLTITQDDLNFIKAVHPGDNARDIQHLNKRPLSVAGTVQF